MGRGAEQGVRLSAGITDETASTMKDAAAPEPGPEEAQVMRLILRAIRDIRYGSVQIVIQDSKVVQIEKVEKIRLV